MDSLRLYACNADEQKEFIDSVERGLYELRSGLGEFVAENDEFFDSIREDLGNKKTTAYALQRV